MRWTQAATSGSYFEGVRAGGEYVCSGSTWRWCRIGSLIVPAVLSLGLVLMTKKHVASGGRYGRLGVWLLPGGFGGLSGLFG